MNVRLVFFLFSVFILMSAHSNAESNKDSLKTLIAKEKDIKTKIDLMNQLSWLMYGENPSEARKTGIQTLTLCEKTDYPEGHSEALNKLGVYEKSLGNYDASLAYYNASRKIFEALKDTGAICMVISNIANIYRNKGNYELALEHLTEALRINEMAKSNKREADILLNIGLIYDELAKSDLAKEYYNRSYLIAKKMEDPERMARALINLANMLSLGNDDDIRQALDYLEKAYEFKKETGDMKGQSMCLNNMGAIYYELGNMEFASRYYQKSSEIKKVIGDRKGMAFIYQNLSHIEKKNGNLNKASEYLDMALTLADSIGDAMLRIDVLKSIADNSMMTKDYKRAAWVYQDLYSFKDSIFSLDLNEKLSEMQAKYEAEKKDREILELQKNKEINEKEIIRQKMARNFMTGIAVLIFILLAGSVYAIIAKRKANRILAMKNTEITQQKEEIMTQRDEIAAQRDLATNQRDIIAKQQKDIKDSINYAFQIQSALFPTDEDLRLILKDYFIFYRPRDIVSGDFYWVNKFGNKIIIVASDCTGHGVPGAFMSMLGIAFLNEIVNKEQVTAPDKILNRLRENIILAMKQHGENVKQQDGMDAVAITIDRQSGTLEFAGANNPLYIVSGSWLRVPGSGNPKPETRNPELIELKGDKMPVAIYSRMQPFTLHSSPISGGDLIYIFSDGFADQFGGPEGKKFKYKPLKELLTVNSQQPMAVQKEALAKTFDDWRGNVPQIDDVLIIGIKV
jgi:serine phosphatase RsbU (regulator of sigma subunit)/TPR repeat protein